MNNIGNPIIQMLGTGVIVSSALIFIGSATPEVKIDVTDLSYEAAHMKQTRIVTGQAPVIARWEAEILDGNTREVVCEGSGYWPYPVGERTARLPLDEWVGEAGCYDSLDPNIFYQGCAIYRWSDTFERACSLGFKKHDGE